MQPRKTNVLWGKAREYFVSILGTSEVLYMLEQLMKIKMNIFCYYTIV